MNDSANQDQIDYWNADAGDKWVRNQESQDQMLAPLGLRALDAAGLNRGDAVLDIGCGCGETTFEAARRVAPGGSALGVDISRQMLARARDRAAALPDLETEFIEADASAYAFEPASRDAAVSRFGVMFFNNPEKAFTNIAATLKPGGRLAFVCWRPLAENEWIRLPMAAARQFTELPGTPPPGTPGPFAFADAQRVEAILAAAGFRDIAFEAFDRQIRIESDPRAAAVKIVDNSPLARVLAGVDDATRDRIRDAVRATMADFDGPEGVRMNAATWIVTAAA